MQKFAPGFKIRAKPSAPIRGIRGHSAAPLVSFVSFCYSESQPLEPKQAHPWHPCDPWSSCFPVLESKRFTEANEGNEKIAPGLEMKAAAHFASFVSFCDFESRKSPSVISAPSVAIRAHPWHPRTSELRNAECGARNAECEKEELGMQELTKGVLNMAVS